MAEIDDGRPLAVGGEEEVGHRLDRPLGGREPDAQRRLPPVRWARRSSVIARCEPRLSSIMAWISSTITVATERSISRPPSEVSRM